MSISYFTPSMNEPALLEAIFTAREPLASQLVSSIRDSVDSGNRHYMLLIGPRGIGKSHLVSLIHNRVKSDPELADRLRIAWLTEDPYSVDSYAGLLREVLMQLDREYGIPRWTEKLATIQDMEHAADIERALAGVLVDFVKPKLLLLIAENLDVIFDSLEDTGQKKFRALLQTKDLATLLVTSPSLIQAAEERDRPFFGFFRNYVLQPLTLRDCVDMLVRMASNQGDTALAQVLSSPVGQARVRAIHHLAGGNPRIYVIFYQFLTRDSLDTLVDPFMKLVNELVPYYQSRMQTISPQQRRLIDTIRKHETPIAVRDIAKAMFTTSQSASSDLGKLRDIGYVTSTKVGRESMYELREPLMRICLATKEQRGETLPLFVEFLRVWFTPAELKGFGEMSERHVLEYKRYEKAIQAARTQQAAKVAFDLKRVRTYRQEGHAEEAIALLLDLFESATDDDEVWGELRQMLEARGRIPELIERAKLRVTLKPESAYVWYEFDYLCYLAKDYEAALEASTHAIGLAPESPRYQDSHLQNLAALGRFVESREMAERLLKSIERNPSYENAMLIARCHDILGDRSSAVAVLIEVLRETHSPYEVWGYLHYLLDQEHADKARLKISEFATTLFPLLPSPWRDHATALSANGLRKEALAAHGKAMELAPDMAEFESERIVFCVLAGDAMGAAAAAAWAEEALKNKSVGGGRGGSMVLSLSILRAFEGDEAESKALMHRYFREMNRDERGRHLPLLTALMLLTRDPASLSRFAAMCVEAGAEHDDLPAVGKALVSSMLCCPSLEDHGIDLAALKTWKQAWQPFADRPELVMPTRLMDAALRFREMQDDTALLDLPLEQREMLRPMVDRYKRWLGLETHALDASVDSLIDAVRSRRASAVQVRRDLLDVDKLMRGYSQDHQAADTLPQLIPGAWTSLPKADAHALLSRLDRRMLFGDAKAKVMKAVRIVKMDAIELRFSSARLYQAHVDIDGRSGAIDLVADDDEVVVLDGGSSWIHEFFERPARWKDVPDAEIAFVRFFCAALRTQNSRFRIIDSEPGMRDAVAARLPRLDIPMPRQTEKDGRVTYEEVIVYEDKLFQVQLRRDFDDGLTGVDMVSDTPLVSELLGFPNEEFLGNVRCWRQEKR